jgi:hypothetical protein
MSRSSSATSLSSSLSSTPASFGAAVLDDSMSCPCRCVVDFDDARGSAAGGSSACFRCSPLHRRDFGDDDDDDDDNNDENADGNGGLSSPPLPCLCRCHCLCARECDGCDCMEELDCDCQHALEACHPEHERRPRGSGLVHRHRPQRGGAEPLPNPEWVSWSRSERIGGGWFPLHGRPGKPGDQVDSDAKIYVRYLFSATRETRPALGTNRFNAFELGAVVESKFKTGDLLLFGGYGMLPSLARLHCGTPYSSAGLIVELPNPYSERPEKYVVEVTRNLDRLHDAFSNSPRNGLCIFRLVDRLHQFHGEGIWYAPLRTPLKRYNRERLIDWTWRMHASATLPFAELDLSRSIMRRYLPWLSSAFGLDYRKAPRTVTDIFSVPFLLMALREANIVSDTQLESAASLNPVRLAALPCFDSPRCLRTRRSPAEMRKLAVKSEAAAQSRVQRQYSAVLDRNRVRPLVKSAGAAGASMPSFPPRGMPPSPRTVAAQQQQQYYQQQLQQQPGALPSRWRAASPPNVLSSTQVVQQQPSPSPPPLMSTMSTPTIAMSLRGSANATSSPYALHIPLHQQHRFQQQQQRYQLQSPSRSSAPVGAVGGALVDVEQAEQPPLLASSTSPSQQSMFSSGGSGSPTSGSAFMYMPSDAHIFDGEFIPTGQVIDSPASSRRPASNYEHTNSTVQHPYFPVTTAASSSDGACASSTPIETILVPKRSLHPSSPPDAKSNASAAIDGSGNESGELDEDGVTKRHSRTRSFSDASDGVSLSSLSVLNMNRLLLETTQPTDDDDTHASTPCEDLLKWE